MLKFSDMETFVSDGLTAKGYGPMGGTGPEMPMFLPGPPTLAKLQTKTPRGLVFLTVGNGIGLAHEGAYDQPFVVVRVLGLQNNYDYAETLAQDIDALLLAVETQTVGAARVLFVTRNAPPQLVDFDASDRYHFQTTYITEVKR